MLQNKRRQIKPAIIFSIFWGLLLPQLIYSQTIGLQTAKNGLLLGGQATFDFYKPYVSIFAHIKPNSTPLIIQQGDESKIYSLLLNQMYYPKFILFQTTFYQLSSLSSYLETDHDKIFARFDLIGDINLLKSIGGGFEEPYAFTLFLGNLVYLSYIDSTRTESLKRRQSGSALAGLAFSWGNHQICDNIYFHDFWYQIELMLTGVLKEQTARKITWNFRAGVKYHKNNLMPDVFIFSVERSHSTFYPAGFSLIKNSVFKYRVYLPLSKTSEMPFFVYQHFSFGKKIPVTLIGKKMLLVLGVGARWEWIAKYDRRRKQFESSPSANFLWLVQPNIEF